MALARSVSPVPARTGIISKAIKCTGKIWDMENVQAKAGTRVVAEKGGAPGGPQRRAPLGILAPST